VSRILDISPALSPRIAVWPGDVPFSREIALSIADGANLDLSSIHTTVHVGAHTDAPSHYVADGADIASRDLSLYLGPCQVVHVDIGRGERILPSHMKDLVQAPRVLFHTGTFPDPDHFDTDFAALSPELVAYLAAGGVRLVGIDTPSIDLFDDAELLSHKAVARHDLAILEGVVLDHVPPGTYTLVALPLKLEGADASPVRAVLLTG
jgi:arylformamidase